MILIEEDTNLSGLEALKAHPAIKSVTPQRMVHRTLKYVPISKDETEKLDADYQTHDSETSFDEEDNEEPENYAKRNFHESENVDNTQNQTDISRVVC